MSADTRMRRAIIVTPQDRDRQLLKELPPDEYKPMEDKIKESMVSVARRAYSKGKRDIEAINLLKECILPQSRTVFSKYRGWALHLLSQTGFFITYEEVLNTLCHSKDGRMVIAFACHDMMYPTVNSDNSYPTLEDPIYVFELNGDDYREWESIEKRTWLQESERIAIGKGIIAKLLQKVKEQEQGGWERDSTEPTGGNTK